MCGVILGLYSLRRRCLISIGIPIINLRRSSDRLRFIMGIPIPIRLRLLSELRPWWQGNHRGWIHSWPSCTTAEKVINSRDITNVSDQRGKYAHKELLSTAYFISMGEQCLSQWEKLYQWMKPCSATDRKQPNANMFCFFHNCNLFLVKQLRFITLYFHHAFLFNWGREMLLCFSKLPIIGSYNGLSPGWHQAIIWTNAGILLIQTLGTSFSETLNSYIFIPENAFENVDCLSLCLKVFMLYTDAAAIIAPINETEVVIWNPGSKLLKYKYWNMQQCFIVFFTVLNIKLHQFLNKHLTEDFFKRKWGVTRKGIPVIKTRWSYSHLILIMGIPIPEKLVLLLRHGHKWQMPVLIMTAYMPQEYIETSFIQSTASSSLEVFNSLRPSDAYMRKETSHPWFR